MRKEINLGFDIQAQPDDVTCGPTCLQALYQKVCVVRQDAEHDAIDQTSETNAIKQSLSQRVWLNRVGDINKVLFLVVAGNDHKVTGGFTFDAVINIVLRYLAGGAIKVSGTQSCKYRNRALKVTLDEIFIELGVVQFPPKFKELDVSLRDGLELSLFALKLHLTPEELRNLL